MCRDLRLGLDDQIDGWLVSPLVPHIPTNPISLRCWDVSNASGEGDTQPLAISLHLACALCLPVSLSLYIYTYVYKYTYIPVIIWSDLRLRLDNQIDGGLVPPVVPHEHPHPTFW